MKDKNEVVHIKYNKKRVNTINTAINVSVCAASAILSGFNPFVIAGSFIACDILLTPMNIVLIKAKINKVTSIEVLEEFQYKLDGLIWTSSSNSDRRAYRYFYSMVEKRISKLRKIKIAEEMAKKDENEPTKLDKTLQTQKDIFNKGVTILKNLNYKETIVPDEEYEEILAKVDKLSSLLDKNDQAYIYVDTTFTLFATEVTNLLNSFAIMDEDISDENRKRMDDLITSFGNYLDRTKDKILNQNEVSINASYEVVIKNIDKTN